MEISLTPSPPGHEHAGITLEVSGTSDVAAGICFYRQQTQ